jgi:uncharacterized protein with beta-barrel porin domain
MFLECMKFGCSVCRSQALLFASSALRARIGSGLIGRTALATAALCIALVTAAAFPALADGGGTSGSGATGGTDNTTGLTGVAGQGGNGQAATGVSGGGGGGGGAGTTGGSGGVNSAGSGSGGAGGVSGVSNGNGGDGNNGNGGGGGAHGSVGTALPGAGAAGGAGGIGGQSSIGQPAGGGGAGGYGAIVTGSGAFTNLGGIISGGNGGRGGNGGGNTGGNGGDGGVGVFFTPAASGATLTNSGTIRGGAGGASGPGFTFGGGGLGGAGIVGAGITIINSGTIIGGQCCGGDGLQANAITFTGGINVLELQAGSFIDGNAVAFSAADTFRLGGTTNASLDVFRIGTQYRGFGIFQKTGSSTWTLTGTNNAVLPWAINAGTLAINATMVNSTMTVNGGGALTGIGTVGNTQVNAGGIFAPGSGTPGSSMAVAGTLAFQSAALYLIQVNPTTASFANVTGAAALGGATVNASFAPGTYVAKQYTILTATGGVNGMFGALVNSNLPSGFTSSLSYDAKDVFLNLAIGFATPGGANGNQQNVINALTNFFNANGGIPAVFGSLTPAGLTQASGETATGSQQTTFDAMTQFLGLLTDPFIDGRGDSATGGAGATPFAEEDDGARAYAANGKARSKSERDAYAAIYRKAPAMGVPFVPSWSVWAAGFGGSQTTDGNAVLGSNTATSRIAGSAVGADYRFSPFTIAGFALAGGGTNFSIANALATGRSDLFQAGAFVRHTVGPAYISAALAYGWQDITTDRTVTIAGVDQLRAKFNANAFSGRVEGGYRFVTPWMSGIGITPYAAGQFTTFDLPAYAEQAIVGANTFALAYGAKSVTASRSELGIRTDKSFAMQDAIFTLRGRFAWAHDFNTDRNIAATFQTLPGASFVVNGAAQAHDAALTTASAEMKWLNGFSLAATFEGEFSHVTRSYAGKGVARYTW